MLVLGGAPPAHLACRRRLWGDRSAVGPRGAASLASVFFSTFLRARAAPGWSASGNCSGPAPRPTRGERRRPVAEAVRLLSFFCSRLLRIHRLCLCVEGGRGGSGGVGRGRGRGSFLGGRAPPRRLPGSRRGPTSHAQSKPRPRPGGARLRVPRRCGTVACGGGAGGRFGRRLRACTACVRSVLRTLGGGGRGAGHAWWLIPTAAAPFSTPPVACDGRFPTAAGGAAPRSPALFVWCPVWLALGTASGVCLLLSGSCGRFGSPPPLHPPSARASARAHLVGHLGGHSLPSAGWLPPAWARGRWRSGRCPLACPGAPG